MAEISSQDLARYMSENNGALPSTKKKTNPPAGGTGGNGGGDNPMFDYDFSDPGKKAPTTAQQANIDALNNAINNGDFSSIFGNQDYQLEGYSPFTTNPGMGGVGPVYDPNYYGQFSNNGEALSGKESLALAMLLMSQGQDEDYVNTLMQGVVDSHNKGYDSQLEEQGYILDNNSGRYYDPVTYEFADDAGYWGLDDLSKFYQDYIYGTDNENGEHTNGYLDRIGYKEKPATTGNKEEDALTNLAAIQGEQKEGDAPSDEVIQANETYVEAVKERLAKDIWAEHMADGEVDPKWLYNTPNFVAAYDDAISTEAESNSNFKTALENLEGKRIGDADAEREAKAAEKEQKFAAETVAAEQVEDMMMNDPDTYGELIDAYYAASENDYSLPETPTIYDLARFYMENFDFQAHA